MFSKLDKIVYTTLAAALVFISGSVLGATSPSAIKQSEKSASLRFTIADRHGFPFEESRNHFDCLEKIYAVSEVRNFNKGKHEIEFRWVAPDGDPREHTRYDFFVTDNPKVNLWAWLELSRAQGASMIQWINPAAGLEEFIGFWEVEIFVDGKSIKKEDFEVSC